MNDFKSARCMSHSNNVGKSNQVTQIAKQSFSSGGVRFPFHRPALYPLRTKQRVASTASFS